MLFAAPQAGAQEATKLRFGQNGNSGTPLAVVIAEREGYFAKENLAVELVDLGGVQFQIMALDEGQVDIAHTATAYLVQAVIAGSPSIAVVGAPANVLYSLVAKPEIKSYADLKGKVIGVSLSQDTISITTRKMLALNGLQEGRDYTSVERIGSTRVACLKSGECDAVLTNSPTDVELAKEGFTILGDSRAAIPDLQFSVLAARKDWAAAHRGELVRFARAIGKAYRFMRAPKNRDVVARVISEESKVPLEAAQKTWATYYQPYKGVMPKHGEINMKGMAMVVTLLLESGEIKAPAPALDQLVDLQYLKAAGQQ